MYLIYLESGMFIKETMVQNLLFFMNILKNNSPIRGGHPDFT